MTDIGAVLDVAIPGLVQVVIVLAVAPLLLGITRRTKARLQYRRGSPLLQGYRDLAKWWGKETVESDASGPMTRLAPPLLLASVLVATTLVPMVGQEPPLAGWGDVIVVVGMLALGRFVLALAALDSGSAFGGMGSSREVAIAALVEPALLLALAGAILAAGSTNLGTIVAAGAAAGRSWFTPAMLLCGAAFAIVAVAETGHEPFDNPDTHLELTMIHEGMLLEATGPRLAILVYAAELKLVLVVGLFAAAFLPAGTTADADPLGLVIATGALLVKLFVAAVALGVLDASIAKLRILALPGLLGMATLLAAIGLATRLWLPA